MKMKPVVLAICLLFSSSMPFYGSGSFVDAPAPVVRSAVFQEVSFARLPFAVMARLLSGGGFVPEYRGPAGDQGPDDRSLSLNKRFTLSPAEKNAGLRKAAAGRAEAWASFPAAAPPPGEGKYRSYLPRQGEPPLRAFLLSYIVALSRGDLPGASMLKAFCGPVTLCARLGFFFGKKP
jgi:hypothetical protein